MSRPTRHTVVALAILIGALASPPSVSAVRLGADAAVAGGDASRRTLSAVQRELEHPGPGRHPVTFSLSAPGVDEVRLELTANYWNARAEDTIVLDRRGDEHAVTLHLGDGQWLYRFRVGTSWVSDPDNPRCVPAETGRCNSVVDVGESLPLFVRAPNVPGGKIVRLDVDSALLPPSRPAVVHLPPGHDPAREYPLLVVLHGYGQGASEWFDVVDLPAALDNRYAAGTLEPMIVLAPEGGTSFYRGRYADHLFDEVLTLVEARWSVSDDPAKRAIAGFSMGGYGALHLASSRSGAFGFAAPIAPGGHCVGTVCGRRSWEADIGDAPGVRYALFTGATDELGLERNQRTIATILDERGVDHVARVVAFPGHRTDGHSVRFVRRLLPELLDEIGAALAPADPFTSSDRAPRRAPAR